jgi:DDE_Tnp_1-associated/ISXO2-like transposase domain
MAPFSNLLAALADVPDPPRVQGKRYPLPYLLMFTVLALLSGARSYRGVITFLEQRREHLNDHFGVNLKRVPVVNTLRTVLQSLPTEALEEAFRRSTRTVDELKKALDNAYLGGERSSGKCGRGAPGKTPIIAAVETTPENQPVRLKLRRVNGFQRKDVEKLARRSLDPTSSGMHALADPHRIRRSQGGADTRLQAGQHRARQHQDRHHRHLSGHPPEAHRPNSLTASIAATISPP